MTESSTVDRPGGHPRHSALGRVVTAPIRWYQLIRADRPSPCRHVPSCSTYAIEAIEAHGSVRGVWLGVRRLSRCHPWGTSGFDPVPGAPDPETKEN
ncbi:MAG: membrane protein insertion efficiency factor YidD [Microthrixaceae bacterium]|nr:membrane protein insertion efficiency factor YidD [Microthrixaceae bacterium]